MVNIKQVVWGPIKYVLHLVSNIAALSEGKQNVHIFIQVYKGRKSGSGKY